ncbi:MAG TPA: IS66 family insertion sequence element accessory protein TnpB [Polyangiaceae bacterium]|nr:IS66 family insertion sequence element accessory protein TnpB [Polyangiaceae bacterium]
MARASREIWAKRVERWKDSGLSAKEFAAELDVSPKSLMFWKWKLRQLESTKGGQIAGGNKRQPRTARMAPHSFVQLVPTPAPPSMALELVLRDGLVLRVAPGFDEATLLQVASLLGAAR